MSIADSLRSFFFGIEPEPRQQATIVPVQTRDPKAAGAIGAMGTTGSRWGVLEPRRGARSMRRFSETNVWVRTAINRRKREISQAEWSIVRVDDPKATVNPKLVKEISELFRFCNPTAISLSHLLSEVTEDILVIDAGTIELERTAGGKLVALWPIDGATILPLPDWDGTPRSHRYVQIVNGKPGARFTNDELLYMMANPRSCSAVGLSPLEVLFDTVSADLYGEDLEYRMMQETAPPGIVYLGSGLTPQQVDSFRAQWEDGIAGSRDIAFLGGGVTMDGGPMQKPEFIPFGRSARDEQRRDYMKWLATKVAAAFEMDLMAFNLSETVHRSIGENLQHKTDTGLLGLAGVISNYITREIVWEFDQNHEHGFQFKNLVKRDEMRDTQIMQIEMQSGIITVNEARADRSRDPVEWGDIPYPSVVAKGYDPAETDGEPEGSTDDTAETEKKKDKDEDEQGV